MAGTLQLSRNVSVRPEGPGRFVVTGSISWTRELVLDLCGMAVLGHFCQARLPAAATIELARELGVPEGDVTAVIDALLAHHLLVPASPGEERPPPLSSGFGDAAEHVSMVLDQHRLRAYSQALSRVARGAAVVDLGSGSGILAILAARAGARIVYAIEETAAAHLAEEMVQRNGVADRVRVLHGNSLDLELPERVDVVVHELFGIHPLGEGVVHYVDDARRRFLLPGGVLVPGRVELRVSGIHCGLPGNPGDPEGELGRIALEHGLDLDPLARGIAIGPVTRVARGSAPGQGDDLLTAETTAFAIDFASAASLPDQLRLELPVQRSGLLDTLVLSFRAHLHEEIVLSTSPAAPETHWGWLCFDLPRPRRVEAGQRVEVEMLLTQAAGMVQTSLALV